MRKSFFTTFLILFCINISLVGSLKDVVRLDAAKFKEGIDSGPHLVLFLTHSCAECKNSAKIFEELNHAHSDGPVQYGIVDCTQEAKLCEDERIRAFPTIKIYTMLNDRIVGIVYNGLLDLNAVENFVGRNFGPGSQANKRLSDEAMVAFTDENFPYLIDQARFTFVQFCASWSTKCKEFEVHWKELARSFQFDGDVAVGTINCEVSKSTCLEFEVKMYPTLLLFEEGIVVDNFPFDKATTTGEALVKFMLTKLGREKVTEVEEAFADEKAETDVVILTKDTYFPALQETKYTFVQYWTAWCSDCERMDQEWETMAYNYNGYEESPIVIANFDCILYKDMCDEQKIVDFPTLNLYKDGQLVEAYKGPFNAKSFTLFLKKYIKGKKSKEL